MHDCAGVAIAKADQGHPHRHPEVLRHARHRFDGACDGLQALEDQEVDPFLDQDRSLGAKVVEQRLPVELVEPPVAADRPRDGDGAPTRRPVALLESDSRRAPVSVLEVGSEAMALHRFPDGGVAVGGDDVRAGIEVAPVHLVDHVRALGKRPRAPDALVHAGPQPFELGADGTVQNHRPPAASRASSHSNAPIEQYPVRITGPHHLPGKVPCQPQPAMAW